ncbi:MAG: hypothetical protein ABL903_10120 [Methylococcales bacterium]
MLKNGYVFTLLLTLPLVNEVMASCVNNLQPSCQVYQTCFSELCPCFPPEPEYFLSYGAKYCEKFLKLNGLSESGMKWRDSTLRCLQEAIVPKLPEKKGGGCNCKLMEDFAFQSHVSCYTKQGASICDLDYKDWKNIAEAAELVKGIVDSKSRNQIVEVAKVCLSKNPSDQIKKVLKGMILDSLTEILEPPIIPPSNLHGVVENNLQYKKEK